MSYKFNLLILAGVWWPPTTKPLVMLSLTKTHPSHISQKWTFPSAKSGQDVSSTNDLQLTSSLGRAAGDTIYISTYLSTIYISNSFSFQGAGDVLRLCLWRAERYIQMNNPRYSLFSPGSMNETEEILNT